MDINSNKPFKKERWDGVLKRSKRENLHVEQECITFLVTRVSSIPNPSRPRRFYPSRLTLQIYTIILLSTQVSVFTSIKELTCFQFEFSVVFNKAIIKVPIDLLYLYISIYIVIIDERLITVVQTERNSTKTSLKKHSRRNVTRTADISIPIVSLFACAIVRSLSIVTHSISTAVRFSYSTLVDI